MSDLLNSASLVMIPSGYKEDVVYSQIPTDGSGDLSFTRASNGTRINSAGLVEVCPWNLLENTNTFSSWNLEGGALTSGFTAPDGTSTAYKYVQVPGSGLYSGNGGVTADVKFAQVWIKSVSGGSMTCNISDGTSFFGTLNVTGTWQLFTAPFTANTRIGLYLYAISNASGIYVWHPQLNIGTTAKPYFPTTDRLNVPRLTYQNGGGGCPSLLLEKQSTNLVTYSEQFDNAVWLNPGGITVTANSTTSPDGTQNADLFSHGSFGTYLYQNLGTLSGTITTSIFVKKGSQSSIAFGFVSGGFGGGMSVIFDFDTQTFGTPTNYSNFTSISATYQSYGNGWYRLNLTGTTATSTTYYYVLGSLVDSFAVNAYLWGAQVEASSYATSYIGPTTSSSATRVADACISASIPSLIGQSEGVMFIDFNKTASLANSFFILSNIAGTSPASYFNSIYLFQISNSAFVSDCFVSNTQQFGFTLSPLSLGRHKIALAYKANDFAIYIDGVLAGTDTSGSVPSMNYLTIGGGADVGDQSQSVNQVALFKTKLTNSELIALTTL